MKRFLLILIFLGFACSMVFASDMRPQWQEFCPQGLENAVYKDIQWYWPDGTKNTQAIYNYWAKRRVEFNDAVAECDFLAGDFKGVCYDNVRAKQVLNNQLYDNDVQYKKISQQVWKPNYWSTNSIMINILSK